MMLNMEILSIVSKQRNIASHFIYDSVVTAFRSGAPEVSYSSIVAGCES